MDLLTKHKFFRNLKCCQIENEEECSTEEELRASMVKMILATDMIFHYNLQDELSTLIESTHFSQWSDSESSDGSEGHSHPHSHQHEITINLPPSPTTPTSPGLPVVLDAQQRQVFCNVLLHAADISNTVRPWPLCKRWSDLVVQEFWRQGEVEKREGLPISPGMDRSDSKQSQISLKFGDFVIKPYFATFAQFLPEAGVYLDALAANRCEWEAMDNSPHDHSPPPLPDEQLPSNIVPENKPVKSPLGRRVSVAAGLIVIPDHLDERWRRHMPSPRRPAAMKRSFSSQRSNSQHLFVVTRPPDADPYEDDSDALGMLRRRSELPSDMMDKEKKTAPTEVSHRNLLIARRFRMRRSSSLDPSITKAIKYMFRGNDGSGIKPTPVSTSKSTDFPRQATTPLGEAAAKLAEK